MVARGTEEAWCPSSLETTDGVLGKPQDPWDHLLDL